MYRRNGAKFFSTAIYRDCVHEMQGQFIDVWQQKTDFPGRNHYVRLRGSQPVEDYFSILPNVSHDSTITAGTILSRFFFLTSFCHVLKVLWRLLPHMQSIRSGKEQVHTVARLVTIWYQSLLVLATWMTCASAHAGAMVVRRQNLSF